jgi:hypothetical protein
MDPLESTIEIERVTNLVGNFGWKLVSRQVTETDIVLTLKKPKPSSLTETSPGPS